MSEYQVLYRKYRPASFTDVVGQPHVVDVLSAQLREHRLSHAYIFSGSRGTGKTSCARILAKAVNCLEPLPDGSPCSKCSACLDIDAGRCIDVTEMNASSERGIDDIRALEDAANTPPVSSKKRVFIIDEFHMLTKEAFNALLKTLEEPPDFVLFILCTTDLQMVPDTILSRCQRYVFTRIEPRVLADRLEHIAEAEGIELDRDAAMLIASVSDGGMRDSISQLDRCASSGERITADLVAAIAGISDRRSVFEIVSACADGDVAQALTLFGKLHESSSDDSSICSELINAYHDLILIKTVKEPSLFIAATAEQIAYMSSVAESLTLSELLRAVDLLSDAKTRMFRSDVKRALMETALIELARPDTDPDLSAVEARISKLERIVNGLSTGDGRPSVKDPVKPAAAAPAAPAAGPARSSGSSEPSLPFDDEEREIAPSGNKADDPLPFDDEPAAPVRPSGSADGVLPLKTVLNMTLLAETYFAPLTGFLKDTVWTTVCDRLTISGCSPVVVKAWERNHHAQDAIKRAVTETLGREYEILLTS